MSISFKISFLLDIFILDNKHLDDDFLEFCMDDVEGKKLSYFCTNLRTVVHNKRSIYAKYDTSQYLNILPSPWQYFLRLFFSPCVSTPSVLLSAHTDGQTSCFQN